MPRRPTPAARDAAVRRVRRVTGLAALGAAALTGAFSVAAAHAFKGHTGHATARPKAIARVAVPGPQHVPVIAAAPRAPRQPPSPAPAPTPAPAPAPAPAPPPPPVTSGSS